MLLVPVGGLHVTGDQSEVLTTCTGSCVAVALYDQQRRVGGMVHVVLPGDRARAGEGEQAGEAYYADSGLPRLVARMRQLGASQMTGWAATLVGGAKLGSAHSSTDIGRKNLEQVEQILGRFNIPWRADHVGGDQGRSVSFAVGSGEVRVRATLRCSTAGTDRYLACNEEVWRQANGLLAELSPDRELAGAVLRAVHQSSVDWAQVDSLVSRDAVLALMTLQQCNSEYYGCPRAVDSLAAALTTLGERQLRRILVIVATSRHGGRTLATLGLGGAQLSQHGLASAVVAEALASDRPERFRRQVFTAALLHATGVLAARVLELAPAGWPAEGAPPATEQVVAPCSVHAAVGSVVLNGWGLPRPVVAGVRDHAATLDAAPDQGDVAAFVHAGCSLSQQLGIRHLFGSADLVTTSSRDVQLSWLRRFSGELPLLSAKLAACGLLAGSAS